MKRSLFKLTLRVAALIACGVTFALMPQESWAEAVFDNISTGHSPSAVAVNVSSNKIYVANSTSKNITVINGYDNSTVTVDVGTTNTPYAVAVNPTKKKVYVANNQVDGTVTIINGDTNSIIETVSAGSRPYAIAVNPSNNMVYVANSSSNNVTVIDGDSNIPFKTITVGIRPVALAVNPNPGFNKVYVATYVDSINNVTVIDSDTNTIITTVTVGTNPTAIAVNTITNMVYVVNKGDNTVTVIDGVTNAVVDGSTLLSVGDLPWAVAVNSITNMVYVASSASEPGTVTVIGGAVGTTPAAVYSTTYVEVSPRSLTINPFNNRIYVANYVTGSVSVIDGNAPTAPPNPNPSVSVGRAPIAITVNTTTNKVYVANQSSDNVSVIGDAPDNGLAVTIDNAPGSGNGNVSITGPPDKICTKGGGIGCSASYTSGQAVMLENVPESTTSVFSGWGGACTSDPCNITMDGNKSATASFVLVPRCKITQTAPDGYGTLQEAYTNANAASEMFALQGLFSGEWKLDKGKEIVLKGGYLADYRDKNRNGFTTLTAKLSISSGKLVVDALKIKPPSP